jgi:hypothetical protein
MIASRQWEVIAMATATAYRMNPFSPLPVAQHRRSSSRLVDLSGPPLEQEFIVTAAGAVLEMTPDAEVFKPLRGERDPLPEADAVDPGQILSSTVAFVPVGPAATDEPPLAPRAEPAGCVVEGEFEGGFYGNPNTIPPDTHGAPGPEAVVTTLNNRVIWHDRSGAVLRDVTLDAFWNVFGQPISSFDPKLFFDALTGRFIAVACGNAQTAKSALLIAVSKSANPLGDWVFGRIGVEGEEALNGVWLDYPSVGFTDDKITVCLNLFTTDGNAFRGVAIFVVDKNAFLNDPHDFVFDQFVTSDQGATLCPAITGDAGITDQYLVSNWTGNSNGKGFLALFRITGSVATDNTSFGRVGFLEVDQTWSFQAGNFAPQQGSAVRIHTGDARMQWVVHRHGRLYLAHTVFLPLGAPTRSAVQWAEVSLDGTPSISDHGLIEDPQGGRFFAHPSLAVNDQGDVLIGMSAFSASTFASGAFAFRPSGGTFALPVAYAPGLNQYDLTFGASRNRWGDYSATHVDPVNGRDFWTIQEYADAVENRWRTRWARIAVRP